MRAPYFRVGSGRSERHGERRGTVRPEDRHLLELITRRELDGRDPREEHIDGDAGFEARERGPGAHMRAAPEREVTLRISAVETKVVGIVEVGGVAVGRGETEGHLVVV